MWVSLIVKVTTNGMFLQYRYFNGICGTTKFIPTPYLFETTIPSLILNTSQASKLNLSTRQGTVLKRPGYKLVKYCQHLQTVGRYRESHLRLFPVVRSRLLARTSLFVVPSPKLHQLWLLVLRNPTVAVGGTL